MSRHYEQLILVCNTNTISEEKIRDVFDCNVEFVEHRGIDVLYYHATRVKDNSSILRMLLERYPKITLRTFKGKHILYHTLIADMCANVDMLLRHFKYNWVYDPNRPCDKSVFHIAARVPLSQRMSDVIINYMATVDWYPIFKETVPDGIYRHLEVMGIIVKSGNIHFLSRMFVYADFMLLRVTFQNDTLLHIAVCKRQLECVRFLLSNLPRLCTKLNKQSRSPLSIVVRNHDLELVELLACCDPSMIYRTVSNVFVDAISRGFVSVVKLLLKHMPKDVRWHDSVWWNVNDISMVEFLLGVDPTLIDHVDDCGRNPLHILVSRKRCPSAMIRILLTRKQSIIHDVENSHKTYIEFVCENNKYNETPYHLAVFRKNHTVMNIFESVVPFDIVFTTHKTLDKNMEHLLQRVASLFDNSYLLPALHHIVFEYLGFTPTEIRRKKTKC